MRPEEGTALYEKRSKVEAQASMELTGRFKLTRDAPMCSGQLLDNVGYLGNTEATLKILKGTFKFVEDMEPHTKLSLEEASQRLREKSTEEIAMMVSKDDYSY